MVISTQSAMWCISFSWNAHVHTVYKYHTCVRLGRDHTVHKILKVPRTRTHFPNRPLFLILLSILMIGFMKKWTICFSHTCCCYTARHLLCCWIMSIHIFIASFLRTSNCYSTTTATAICLARHWRWRWRCIIHVIRMGIPNEIMIVSAAVLLHYQKELVISIVNAFFDDDEMIKETKERGSERQSTLMCSNRVII